MNLIRIGPLIVNLDRVTTIRDLTPDPGAGPRLVRIEFAEGRSVDVTAQAQALLSWIGQHSADVAATTP